MDTREALEEAQRQREVNALDQNKAMYDLANDLTYPVDHQGNVLNVHFLIPTLAYHLARCGYRKDPEKATIIQQPIPGAAQGELPGVVEDAVRYVPVDAQGQLPEMFRKQQEDPAMRDQVNKNGWGVKTHITVDGSTIKGGV